MREAISFLLWSKTWCGRQEEDMTRELVWVLAFGSNQSVPWLVVVVVESEYQDEVNHDEEIYLVRERKKSKGCHDDQTDIVKGRHVFL
jgi:hypothetical protein